MPEEEVIKRAREDEREGKSPSTQAGEFVREEMEHIFVYYNDARGKKFKPTARKGPAAAERLIKNQTKKRK
jgi:hypothetical protein